MTHKTPITYDNSRLYPINHQLMKIPLAGGICNNHDPPPGWETSLISHMNHGSYILYAI